MSRNMVEAFRSLSRLVPLVLFSLIIDCGYPLFLVPDSLRPRLPRRVPGHVMGMWRCQWGFRRRPVRDSWQLASWRRVEEVLERLLTVAGMSIRSSGWNPMHGATNGGCAVRASACNGGGDGCGSLGN
jgi:hypothetical protein